MSIHGLDVLKAVRAALDAPEDDYAPGVTDIYERVRKGAECADHLRGSKLQLWLEDLDRFNVLGQARRYSKAQGREVLRIAQSALAKIKVRKGELDEKLAGIEAEIAAAVERWPSLAPLAGRSARIQTVVTPTGPLSVIRPVAEQLLSSGVISGTLDGDLHAADAATVKAALMTSAGVCDFCSAPGAINFFDVPDFDMPRGVGRSTGGWAACDTCADFVSRNRRDALLKRSIESASFGKFSGAAIAELQAKFWRGMDEKAEAAAIAAALCKFVDDEMPSYSVATLSDRDQRIEAVARITGLDWSKVARLTSGDIDSDAVRRLVDWRKSFGKDVDPRQLADLLAGGPHKPLAPIMPHWQVALDMRFAAMSLLAKAEPSDSYYTPAVTDLNDTAAVRKLAQAAELARSQDVESFRRDLSALRHAETYSFNAETAQAITLAAASIPRDTPLSAIETPGTGRSGWFWFADPLLVRTCSESAVVHAILWYWEQDHGRRPQIGFSAYTVFPYKHGVRTQGDVLLPVSGDQPMPSTNWNWYLTETLDEMLTQRRDAYRKSEHEMRTAAGTVGLLGEDRTVQAITDLSTFFVAACVWMKQRIAVGEAGHIERHARKRYVREHKLSEPPSVQVIALRKSYREPTGEAKPTTGDGTTRQYHHKWVVSGHPRLQACGPNRADRKLIWIDPYPKGNPDAPLLVRKRVYAVVR